MLINAKQIKATIKQAGFRSEKEVLGVIDKHLATWLIGILEANRLKGKTLRVEDIK